MASDVDSGRNGEIVYSIMPGDTVGSQCFRIDSRTGEIYISKQLSKEDIKIHKITIQASDSGIPFNKSTQHALTIDIKDQEYSPLVEFPERPKSPIVEILGSTSNYLLIAFLITGGTLLIVAIMFSLLWMHTKRRKWRDNRAIIVPKHRNSFDVNASLISHHFPEYNNIRRTSSAVSDPVRVPLRSEFSGVQSIIQLGVIL